jgi:large subunit ribosomal protein L10
MVASRGEPRPEKVAVIDEVRSRMDRSNAAILTEYRGLTVKDLAALRRSLRESGADYKVYKNTLVRFAAVSLDLDGLVPLLEGPTAIAFTDGDAVPMAKALRDFARANTRLVVKGGVLRRRVMSLQDTTALADLPPREVVLARLAGALAAPMQQLAGLLGALPRNFAYGLKALAEQGGAAGTQPAAGDGAPSDPGAHYPAEAGAAEARPGSPDAG